MWTTLGTLPESWDSLPPVTIVVTQTEEHLLFKISDQGGGVPGYEFNAEDTIWKFGYSSNDQSELIQTAFDSSEGSEDDSGEGSESDSSHSEVSGLEISTNGINPEEGHGFGLPLSRIYARFSGGDIRINTVPGYGTDVFVRMKRLKCGIERQVPLVKV